MLGRKDTEKPRSNTLELIDDQFTHRCKKKTWAMLSIYKNITVFKVQNTTVLILITWLRLPRGYVWRIIVQVIATRMSGVPQGDLIDHVTTHTV